MWGGSISLRTPMLFSIGFIGLFTIGGISGVFQAAIPLDYIVHDTQFVVGHLHYVLFGGTIMGIFAGLYFWYPTITRRMYSERLGVAHFVFTMIGMNMVFFPMHLTGWLGQPRRTYDYSHLLDIAAIQPLNLLMTVGAFILAFGMLLFFYNMVNSTLRGKPSEPDPWEHL